MAGIQIAGFGGVVAEVESNTRALRSTPRPIDVGSLGSYAIDTATGTVTTVTVIPVYSFRWGSANVGLVRVIRVAMASVGAFTAGLGLYELVIARGFTASDTGGTSILPTGNSQKKRTSFGTTLVTDLRQATTGTLTAGTRTLDAAAMSAISFAVGTAANTVYLPTTAIFAPDWSGEWPLVLAQNEGFILRATMPATGTYIMRTSVEWSEVASF